MSIDSDVESIPVKDSVVVLANAVVTFTSVEYLFRSVVSRFTLGTPVVGFVLLKVMCIEPSTYKLPKTVHPLRLIQVPIESHLQY